MQGRESAVGGEVSRQACQGTRCPCEQLSFQAATLLFHHERPVLSPQVQKGRLRKPLVKEFHPDVRLPAAGEQWTQGLREERLCSPPQRHTQPP